jgi:hypothetical protein
MEPDRVEPTECVLSEASLQTKQVRFGIARTSAIGSMGLFVLVVISLLFFTLLQPRKKQQEIVVTQTLTAP